MLIRALILPSTTTSILYLSGVAIFGTSFLYLIGIGLYKLFGGETPPFIMIKQELDMIPLYLSMVVLMPWNGPVGEEFGWREFALPRLQKKYSPVITSVIISAIWGVWHLPSFFTPLGVLPFLVSVFGLGFIVPYTLGTIANSIFMTWMYNKTNSNALIAGIVWHAAINFWAPILLSDSSLTAAKEGTHLPTIPAMLYLTVLGVQIVCALLLAITTKGRLRLNTIQKEK